MVERKNKVSRWYFGGIASAGAACITHPLDLLKVTLQTQQDRKVSMLKLTGKIIKKQGNCCYLNYICKWFYFITYSGVTALYNGISASLGRQLTYSTTRFGIYEVAKQSFANKGDYGFFTNVGIAAVAGAAGGFVGTPADMVNVRMQNDVKLDPEKRRK